MQVQMDKGRGCKPVDVPYAVGRLQRSAGTYYLLSVYTEKQESRLYSLAMQLYIALLVYCQLGQTP